MLRVGSHRSLLSLASLAAAFALAIVAAGCGGSGQVTTVTAPPKTPAKGNSTSALSFTGLVARVRTGVIRIEAATCAGEAIGTGFLVGPKLVATVEHVVDGATGIVLKRAGIVLGTGTVVGQDKDRDLALVRTSKPISGYVFRLAPRAPQLGEAVAAFGFPLGLPLTVTRGSVSGLGRTIPIDNFNRTNLVQTDAAVNPGNSGGPLLSTDTHEVVGLVDLGTTQANNISFAVSALVAAPLIEAWKSSPQPVLTSSCGGGTSQAAPSSSSTRSASQDPAAVSGAIYGYWNAIQGGDYLSAFGYLSPSEQQAVGGSSKFVSQHSQDPLTSVTVDVSVVTMASATATAVVNQLQTRATSTGCRNWSGSYQLSYDSVEGWLIDSAKLSFTPC